MRPATTALLALLVAGAALGKVSAASLGISPLELTVPADGRSTIVRLRNQADEEVLVQVVAVEWREPGEIDAAPLAHNILVVPPVMKLQAMGRQVIRVALRRPSKEPIEQAYRLLITEVPSASPQLQNGLFFAARMNLPLFVTPNGAAPSPVWKIREMPDGAAELVLRNEGQAHLRVSKLALHEPGDALSFIRIDEGVYALPGKEHSWRLDQPVHALPEMIQVRAETQLGELVMPLNQVRE